MAHMKANGKFGATYIGMDVEGGMNLSVLERKFGVRPYVGIEGKINKHEGMKEEGVGVFALRIKEGMYITLLGRLGVMVGNKYDWNMRLEYKRLMSGGEPEIKCSLSNGYYFSTTANREGLDKFGIGISGVFKISNRLGVGLGAALEVSDNNRNLEGFVGLGYRFGHSLHSKSSGQQKELQHKEGEKEYKEAVTTLPVIEFLFDSIEITQDSLKNLYFIADQLKNYPDGELLITGHTDSIGMESYNEILSLRRALRLSNFLSAVGIKCKMEVCGKGSREPLASNSTEQDRQRNRRVSISCSTLRN
jgi:outer membrane protein OmpA-like peptidoglycan-associated protein